MNNLKVVVENNELKITIGINELCHSFDVSQDTYPDKFKIVDRELFTKEVACYLENEDGYGEFPMHKLFYEAANDVIENGSMSVEEISQAEYDRQGLYYYIKGEHRGEN